MKAERNNAPNTLRGTLLLRTANSRTLAKHRVHHPEGSLPSSLANRYFDCQKTKGAGFKLPREAARSFNSLNLLLRFGSGSPLPLINAWCDADLWAFPGRVYRQNNRPLTRSGPTNRRRRAWRRSAARASCVRVVSYSSSSKFVSHLHCADAQGLCCIKYQYHSCQEFYFSKLSC